jgi:antitoxin HicB
MLVTEGDSIDEVLENVKDAFVTTLELYEDLGHPLPESIQSSSPAVLPKDISLSLPKDISLSLPIAVQT